jgi:two-component system chemotaxis response regulator CheY
MKTLIVEDDFTSRLVLQTFLSRYGECHIAVNGKEAVEAFRASLDHGPQYDLVCMDIMMPEMDGREAVRQIREIEEARASGPQPAVKIIMTTALNDLKEVTRCFRELCDSYLVKPIDLSKLLEQIKAYELMQPEVSSPEITVP